MDAGYRDELLGNIVRGLRRVSDPNLDVWTETICMAWSTSTQRLPNVLVF